MAFELNKCELLNLIKFIKNIENHIKVVCKVPHLVCKIIEQVFI